MPIQMHDRHSMSYRSSVLAVLVGIAPSAMTLCTASAQIPVNVPMTDTYFHLDYCGGDSCTWGAGLIVARLNALGPLHRLIIGGAGDGGHGGTLAYDPLNIAAGPLCGRAELFPGPICSYLVNIGGHDFAVLREPQVITCNEPEKVYTVGGNSVQQVCLPGFGSTGVSMTHALAMVRHGTDIVSIAGNRQGTIAIRSWTNGTPISTLSTSISCEGMCYLHTDANGVNLLIVSGSANMYQVALGQDLAHPVLRQLGYYTLNGIGATAFDVDYWNGRVYAGSEDMVGSGPFTPRFRCSLADFSIPNGVSIQDIFDFLSAWFGADPLADVNDADGVTVQDVFDFLLAWFAGC